MKTCSGKNGWVKYDVEVDSNCDKEQAAGEGREEGEENVIKTETRGLKKIIMKTRNAGRNGAIGSHNAEWLNEG